VLGCRFYVMERVRGLILRREPPAGVEIDPGTARRMCESLIDGMVELHAIDYRAIGLGDLGRPEGYVERQVRGWTERYAGSRTDDIPAVTRVAEWLAGNMPQSGAPSLIHNDYKFDNLVLDPSDITRIIGVLDWEMATVGDPLMDLGTSLAYWVEAGDPEPLKGMRFGPTVLDGMMTRAEVAAHYAARSGRPATDIVFYFAFGLFKTAVVVQQIYYRWKQGLTQDPRFAPLIHAVGLLCDRAALAIQQRSL
jgi:aminoglycoside phosphotransferase (APT) family kinase protein